METVKINMVPKGAVKAAHASQGDAPRVVRFELFDELLPYTLDGSENISLKVVRPDTEEIVSSVTNTEEAYIDVSFTSEMTAIRGVANCEIRITKSGAEIGSHNFDLNIERDAYGEDITVETAQGVIATFTTGVIDNLVGLKTTFEPKQDLHGYETPWIDSNVVNKTPYLSRALAGTASRIGNYEFNKLVGGTYAFNQLCKVIYYSGSGVTITTDANGLITLNGTAESTIYGWINNFDTFSILNHVYFLAVNNAIDGVMIYNDSAGVRLTYPDTQIIGKAIDNKRFYMRIQSGTVLDNETLRINIIDLTQLFGATIADYIYSLETAQAGAGVSFFKSLFDKDYYPYNAGELMSVKTSAHVTKDANNNVISNIALDPDIELRGIPKLDENNKLYYDGDTYESNGDVTRRYGIVDLGSLTWEYLSDYTFWRSTGIASLVKTQASQMDMINFIAYPYIIHNTQSLINLGLNCLQVGTSGNLLVNNGSDNVTPSGYLVYELATPTTESADPFTDPQEIDASGSEEFIDARAVSIPVGHESYYANICEIEGIDSITFYHSGEDTQDPESVTVEIGQEVYGGYYDKDLGIVLTSKLVDLGSLSFGAGFGGFYTGDLKNEIKIVTNLETPNLLSSVYKAIAYSNLLTDINTVAIVYGGADYAYNGIVVFNDTRYPDAASFKAAMNGVTLCYELETPIIIPADAVNFETVKGANNVWSDTNGETEVKFFVKES